MNSRTARATQRYPFLKLAKRQTTKTPTKLALHLARETCLYVLFTEKGSWQSPRSWKLVARFQVHSQGQGCFDWHINIELGSVLTVRERNSLLGNRVLLPVLAMQTVDEGASCLKTLSGLQVCHLFALTWPERYGFPLLMNKDQIVTALQNSCAHSPHSPLQSHWPPLCPLCGLWPFCLCAIPFV